MPRSGKVPCFQPFGLAVHGTNPYTIGKKISIEERNFIKLMVPEIIIPDNAILCIKCRIHYSNRKRGLQEVKVKTKRSKILDAIVTGLRKKSPNSVERATEEFENKLNAQEIDQVLHPQDQRTPSGNASPQGSDISTGSRLYPMLPEAPESVLSDYREDVDKTNKLNAILEVCEQSPFDRRKSRSAVYSSRKFEKASKVITEEMSKASRRPITPRELLPAECHNCADLINRMVPKFQQLTSRIDKYKLLTSLPRSVTIAEMVDKFHCSQYMAKLVSQLRRDKGPFSAPIKKDFINSKITPQIRQLVTEFYIQDENSRVMPGMRDTIYVKNPNTGVKEKKAKRQMLMSQADFYAEFRNCNPGIQVGFTSVGKLKPKYCVWPGISGFKRTCMCEIHQNFELLLEALNVHWNIHQILDAGLCDAVNERCSMGLCNECPKYDVIEELLTPRNDLEDAVVGPAPNEPAIPNADFEAQREEFNEDDIVHFFQWTRDGRTNLVEKIAARHEVLQNLIEMIPKIAEHHFLLKQQNQFFKQLKVSVRQENAVIVHMDFAENYDFTVQDEVQGYHWTNNQMTIHPFYCQWSRNGVDLVHKTFAVISDCLEHNADTVEVFRSRFMEHIKADIPDLKKVYFCSDGTGAQYKNYKNFLNTMELSKDHNVESEIHFTVSYHGKSECDALSAQIKRSLRLASLRDKKFITTADAALKYCTEKLACETLNFIYIKKEVVSEMKPKLEERYKNGKTIPGTRSFHCVKFLQHGEIEAKPYSLCIEGKKYRLGREVEREEPVVNSLDQVVVGSYVVINMLGIKTLGRIEAVKIDDGGFTFKPMKRRKGANSFQWPIISHSLFISFDDFLFCVQDPITENGSTFKLFPVSYDNFNN
jgi:hypothetical protein